MKCNRNVRGWLGWVGRCIVNSQANELTVIVMVGVICIRIMVVVAGVIGSVMVACEWSKTKRLEVGSSGLAVQTTTACEPNIE